MHFTETAEHFKKSTYEYFEPIFGHFAVHPDFININITPSRLQRFWKKIQSST